VHAKTCSQAIIDKKNEMNVSLAKGDSDAEETASKDEEESEE
jgi:hypothetical protein